MLSAAILTSGLAIFAATGDVYAGDRGCVSGAECSHVTDGVCGFVDYGGSGACVCTNGLEGDCSTGEYPPCASQEN